MKDDVLWMGEIEAVVNEVDPIRGLIKVTLATNVQLDVGPEELERKRPEPQKVSTRKKRRIPLCQESTLAPAPAPAPPPCEQDHKESPAALISVAEMNFEFSVIVQDDVVFKVGSLYFVDSCSFPFIITRLFKLSLSGSVFVSGARCVIEGEKVVSFLDNFQVTVECSFVHPCSSSQFGLSNVSSQVANYVFCGHSRVGVCQERNFGNVHYLRDLRRHALGAQMRQAVSSGISLNATRPAQPISLGALEPFHDMAIFGLSEVNKFKIPFTLVGGYSLLDGIMGKGWDVKPLRADVADCHFKFVTSLTVYLDRKHFTLTWLHFH